MVVGVMESLARHCLGVCFGDFIIFDDLVLLVDSRLGSRNSSDLACTV